MKTISNCKVIKMSIQRGIGYPETIEEKCLGYSPLNDDEPIEKCKNCKSHCNYEED